MSVPAYVICILDMHARILDMHALFSRMSLVKFFRQKIATQDDRSHARHEVVSKMPVSVCRCCSCSFACCFQGAKSEDKDGKCKGGLQSSLVRSLALLKTMRMQIFMFLCRENNTEPQAFPL